MDWRTAYLNQARWDFEMFRRLEKMNDVPPCYQLHYLQMATEKLAKGYLTLPGGGPYERTHDAFLKFMRVAKKLSEIRKMCGFSSSEKHKSYNEYIDGLIPIAGQIENLSPEGDDHPNPEYPWVDARGNVISPLNHRFTGLDMTHPKMVKLVEFLNSLLQIPAE